MPDPRWDSAPEVQAKAGADTPLEGLAFAATTVATALGVDVATALGVDVGEGHATVTSATDAQGGLAGIAAAWQMRTREVSLASGWWTTDVGPLIGYAVEPPAAVALLPGRRGSYRAVTSDRETTIDGPGSAQAYGASASQLVRTLPESPSSVGELVRFALVGSRRDVTIAAVAAAVTGFALLGIPLASGAAADAILTGRPLEPAGLAAAGTIAVVLAAVAAVPVRAGSIAIERVGHRAAAALGPAVWDRLLRLPPSFLNAHDRSDLARIAAVADSGSAAFAGRIGVAVMLAIATVPSLLLMLLLQPLVGVTAGLGLGLFAIGLTALFRQQVRAADAYQTESGKLLAMTAASVGSAAQLRAAGATARVESRWAAQAATAQVASERARSRPWLQATVGTVLAALSFLGILLVIVAGPRMGAGAATSVTVGVAAVQVFILLTLAASRAMDVARQAPVLGRLSVILDAVPSPLAAPPSSRPGGATGIAFESVEFAFPPGDRRVLEDVTFDIEPGDLAVLTGPSGSGKSTIVRLILGLAEPTEGRIRRRDVDPDDGDGHHAGLRMAAIDERSTLFAADILTNIVAGSGLGEAQAWQAAAEAGVTADITAMPMGLATFVGEGGMALSLTQRQRIQLARALAVDPALLVIDAMDGDLDLGNGRRLRDLLGERTGTRIIVSDDPATIAAADLVVTVEGGRMTSVVRQRRTS